MMLNKVSAWTALNPKRESLDRDYQMSSTPPRHRYLTRDERLQCQTLRLAGHKQEFIADLLGFTRRQVGYALASKRVTLKKRKGRP